MWTVRDRHVRQVGGAVSKPASIDEPALRARLNASLDSSGPGSLYLRVLCCVYLACDEDSEDEELALQSLMKEQARLEGVDEHALTEELILAGTRGAEVPS